MVRLTISHINKYGPLLFPAHKVQLFVEDHNIPKENLWSFYQKLVDNWFVQHPERQQLGEYEKDIVDKNSMPNGSKIYGPSDYALGKIVPVVTEEDL